MHGKYFKTQVKELRQSLLIDSFLSDAENVGTTGNTGAFIFRAASKPDCCKRVCRGFAGVPPLPIHSWEDSGGPLWGGAELTSGGSGPTLEWS